MNAALAAVQTRHARRMTGQADALMTGSTHYDDTDGDGADAVTTVSV